MKKRINELLENHKPNLNVLDDITPNSIKYLYESLVEELVEIQTENNKEEN